jgi:uncharacterized protein (TIGR02598 family)
MNLQKNRLFSRGFTLAEVMIAMGIVATVMVGLLGMIPLGVRSVREATNLTITGRIAQEVIGNIQQANWKDVEKSFDKKTFFFDNEGFLIRSGNKSTPSFQARVLMDPLKVTIGTTNYGLDTLRKIQIEVEFTPDGRKVPQKPEDNKKGNPNISKFNFYVANQNKTG